MEALKTYFIGYRLIALIGLLSLFSMVIAIMLAPSHDNRDTYAIPDLACSLLVLIWIGVSFWYKVRIFLSNENSFSLGIASVLLFVAIAIVATCGVNHHGVQTILVDTPFDYLGMISLFVVFLTDISLLLMSENH